jgi:hypothetical protein
VKSGSAVSRCSVVSMRSSITPECAWLVQMRISSAVACISLAIPSAYMKAYPEDVTRLNLMLPVNSRLTFSGNGLYYWRWHSPLNVESEGGVMVDLVARYALSARAYLSPAIKNVLNENSLWPMNSNAGDRELSPGAPAAEARAFWVQVRFNL